MQLAALVELQLIWVLPPLTTLVGLAAIETVGVEAGGWFTVTEADPEVDPPLPEQVSVKVLFCVKPDTVSLPLVALAPAQPSLAEQLDALVELQLS